MTNKARIHEKVLNGVETYPWETNIDLSYTYGGPRPHAPTQVGDTNISYDASGNITQLHNTQTGELKDLIWDDDGRLIQSETQLGLVRNYYDGTGLRVLKRSENGGDTVFVNSYFDLKLVDGNDPLGTKHIYADGMRVCSTFEGEHDLTSTGNIPPQDAGKSYYFLGDHLGSSNLLTRDDGTVHEHYEYFPDGEIWIEQKPNLEIENGYLFTGKFLDEETGFYDFGQRFYDPKTGIWLSTDPLFTDTPGEAVGRPMVMSLYAYGAQSPIRFIDPDGRDIEDNIESRMPLDETPKPYPPEAFEPPRKKPLVTRVKERGKRPYWKLTKHSLDLIQPYFTKNLEADLSKVRIYEKGALLTFLDGLSAKAKGKQKVVVKKNYFKTTEENSIQLQIRRLVHEFVHVAQYRVKGAKMYRLTAETIRNDAEIRSSDLMHIPLENMPLFPPGFSIEDVAFAVEDLIMPKLSKIVDWGDWISTTSIP